MPILKDLKRETFCQHYALTLDVGKAEEVAGFTHKYGYELRKSPEIMDRIAEIQRESGINMQVDQTRVIREAAYLGFSDITDVLQVNSVAELRALPENVRRAIKRVKVTRTPMRGQGGRDRGVPRTTEGVEAIAESGDTRINELSSNEYEETIEIEMHPKVEPLKLLALVTDAIKNPETRDLLNAGAFTGMTVKVLSPPKGGKNVTKEQKDDAET